MRIGGATAVAGLIGRPIAGSLSPVIHNAWLAAGGVDGVYVPFDLADGAAVRSFVSSLRGGHSVRGVNVTAPFKEDALAAADWADEDARRAGAANLLVFQADGTVAAYNTDGLGLLYALRSQAGRQVRGARVVLLGAGGAARGAAATLMDAGAAEVRIVNRSRERAEALAAALGGAATSWTWDDAERATEGVDLLINATTLGREGAPALDISLDRLDRGAAVMDMGYRPLRSPLLEEAAARGLVPVDGLAMLIGQAIPSFERLFGTPPPEHVDVRARALEAMA